MALLQGSKQEGGLFKARNYITLIFTYKLHFPAVFFDFLPQCANHRKSFQQSYVLPPVSTPHPPTSPRHVSLSTLPFTPNHLLRAPPSSLCPLASPLPHPDSYRKADNSRHIWLPDSDPLMSSAADYFKKEKEKKTCALRDLQTMSPDRVDL